MLLKDKKFIFKWLILFAFVETKDYNINELILD